MAKIRNAIQVERWLRGKPRLWGRVIALRAALRVLPLYRAPDARSDLTLSVIRALFVSQVAMRWPTEEMPTAASTAYTAADQAANAAYATTNIARAFAADAAARSAAMVFARPGSAFRAANATRAAAINAAIYGMAAADVMWLNIETDAEELEAAKDREAIAERVLLSRLWPAGYPNTLEIVFPEFKGRLLTAGNGWDEWVYWYERCLNGSEIAFAGLDDRTNEQFCVQLATENNDFWERDPALVNGEIVARLAALRTPQIPPHAEDLPQQNPKAQTFVQDDTGRIALAPRSSERQLGQAPEQVTQYEEFQRSFRNLVGHGQACGAHLTSLAAHAGEAITESITDVDPDRLWPRINRFRGCLRKHEAACRSSDFSPDRLDAGVVEDLRDLISNYNILCIGQPILAEKESFARGPVREDDAAYAAIHNLTINVAGNVNVTAPETGRVVKDAVADAETTSTDDIAILGKQEGRKVQRNFVLKILDLAGRVIKGGAKGVAEGATREAGKEAAAAVAANAPQVAQFVAAEMPECATVVEQMFEALSHIDLMPM